MKLLGITQEGLQRLQRYREASFQPTEEMQQHFFDRTHMHMDLVGKYCKRVLSLDDQGLFGNLLVRAHVHDMSKFEDPEVVPYVYITWQYKCKDEGEEFELPSGMDELMNKATEHHVKMNRHHPEFHSPKEVDLINREDRDKPPDELIDARGMPALDVVEMVADWCAMSEEKGNSPKEWADKNVNVRWGFSPTQVDLIYGLIDKIW